MSRRLVIAFCFIASAALFANNPAHLHPEASKTLAPSEKKLKYPGYCEIEVINNSFDNIRVFGIYDDGAYLSPFSIYTYESPHYISLYYYGYCHSGMNVFIDTFSGYRIYSGYTATNSTIRVVPVSPIN